MPLKINGAQTADMGVVSGVLAISCMPSTLPMSKFLSTCSPSQVRIIIKMAQHLDSRCLLLPAPWVPGGKTRLHTPKAVTYHEQPHYCRFMIGHSLGRIESSIKKFKPPFNVYGWWAPAPPWLNLQCQIYFIVWSKWPSADTLLFRHSRFFLLCDGA